VEGTRVLRCAVVGAPNAGKSVLVNALVGRKVSAASAKRHTTRERATGIFTERDAQVVLEDSPGLLGDP